MFNAFLLDSRGFAIGPEADEVGRGGGSGGGSGGVSPASDVGEVGSYSSIPLIPVALLSLLLRLGPKMLAPEYGNRLLDYRDPR